MGVTTKMARQGLGIAVASRVTPSGPGADRWGHCLPGRQGVTLRTPATHDPVTPVTPKLSGSPT